MFSMKWKQIIWAEQIISLLTPDFYQSFHQHTPTSGYVDLDLNFTAALGHNITVIVYATFNELSLKLEQ